MQFDKNIVAAGGFDIYYDKYTQNMVIQIVNNVC